MTKPVNKIQLLKTANRLQENFHVLEFGQRIRNARLAHGLTQAQVAEELGISKGYVSRLEGGKARPAESTVTRLADVCATDPRPLLILSGHIPEDIRDILRRHPVEAPEILERALGTNGHESAERVELKTAVAKPRPGDQSREVRFEIVCEDCFDWMERRRPESVHAIVTDPPYGLKEYSTEQKDKLRKGRGGVWRNPPAIDGYVRRPLPRFTVLKDSEKLQLEEFFLRWGTRALEVLVPGGHIFIAANPILSQLVYTSLVRSGFEKRGEIIRLVQTLRGGDRPKNAHDEFRDITVMPRSCWEPWGLFRKPCEGHVRNNLRKWKTGGLRRISDEQPFRDVIKSSPTHASERDVAPHPSLKPQDFMRRIVRAALPLGEGTVLDPFMGGGSTIAAACAVGYASIGIESDPEFFEIAKAAIPKLARIPSDGKFGNHASVSQGTGNTQMSLFG